MQFIKGCCLNRFRPKRSFICVYNTCVSAIRYPCQRHESYQNLDKQKPESHGAEKYDLFGACFDGIFQAEAGGADEWPD